MDKLATLLTISEAAKSAEDLSESQLRKLCADGWLRSTRVGRHRVIHVDDLMAFLKARADRLAQPQ